MQRPDDLCFLGRTNWRDRMRPFGIFPNDRMAYVYAVGQTGTGKTTLLQNLIWQGLRACEEIGRGRFGSPAFSAIFGG